MNYDDFHGSAPARQAVVVRRVVLAEDDPELRGFFARGAGGLGLPSDRVYRGHKPVQHPG
jgi:hypothetical protein